MSTNLTLPFSKELTAVKNVKETMKAFGASRPDMFSIDPRKVRFIEGFNPRTDRPEYEAHLEHLTASIMENGFYQDKPIAVFVANEDGEDVIYCTEGHSRTTASIRAMDRGWPGETIPAVVKPKGTAMDDLLVALMTSNDGLPLTPFEIGITCKRLIDSGWDVKKISQKINRTVPYINDLLDLVSAPKAIRDMVVAGKVSATAAVKELKAHGPKAVVVLQEAADHAKAAGKTKITGKHIPKKAGKAPQSATLKLTGSIQVKHKMNANALTIVLDNPLEVELIKGDRVRLVIMQGDEEL